MDQRPYPGPPPLFHIRVFSLFGLLGLTDVLMLTFTVESTLRYGVGATVLFANEVYTLWRFSGQKLTKITVRNPFCQLDKFPSQVHVVHRRTT